MVINLVAVAATGGTGTLAAGTGALNPSEPTVAFAPIGTNNAAVAIVPLAGTETVGVNIAAQAGATVHIRMIVLGYLDNTGGSLYVPTDPCAAFDTRSAQGATGSFEGRRTDGNTTTYQVTGSIPSGQGGLNGGTCNVPSTATGVLINVVAVAPVQPGNLRGLRRWHYAVGWCRELLRLHSGCHELQRSAGGAVGHRSDFHRHQRPRRRRRRSRPRSHPRILGVAPSPVQLAAEAACGAVSAASWGWAVSLVLDWQRRPRTGAV